MRDEDLVNRRREALIEFEKVIKEEEVFWYQKAKCKWLKDGDGNTKFFHKVANRRKRKKSYLVLEWMGTKLWSLKLLLTNLSFFILLFTEKIGADNRWLRISLIEL